MKKWIIIVGIIVALIGFIMQIPYLGKGYMTFIEGSGYMPLMLGLIIIVLGFATDYLMLDGEEDDDTSLAGTTTKDTKEKGKTT